MNTEQMHKNMFSFWQSGNSLVAMLEWLKGSFKGDEVEAIMSSFVKKHYNNEDLKKEFNSSCFIKNIHK